MLISKKVEAALNKQLGHEAAAAHSYLAMASWCEKEGLDGAAEFFYNHAQEEQQHFMKFFKYINEVGGHAKVPAIKQPKLEYTSVQQTCELALKHEKSVTKSIHDLVHLAQAENDYATNEFLRYFVDEQMEEEVLFQKVLDRIKLIGTGGQSLFYIDSELSRLIPAAEAEE